MKGVYVFGAKPLQKRIEPGTEPYLAVAMNKLRGLYLNPAPFLSLSLLIGDVSIKILKTPSFDRIDIAGGIDSWVAVAETFQGLNWTQMAIGAPGKKWVEPDGYALTSRMQEFELISNGPIWTIGVANILGLATNDFIDSTLTHGGHPHSFGAGGVTLIRNNNANIPEIYTGGMGVQFGNETFRIFATDDEGGLGIFFGFIGGEIEHDWQFQFVYNMNTDLNKMVLLGIGIGYDRDANHRFIAYDIVNGLTNTETQIPDPRGGGGPQPFVYRYLVDTVLGKGAFVLAFIFLTPDRIITYGYTNDLQTQPLGTIKCSVDGGRSFATTAGSNMDFMDVGATTALSAIGGPSMAALNSNYALRAGLHRTLSVDPGIDPSAYVTHAVIDYRIEKVGIDGSIALLHVLDTVTPNFFGHVGVTAINLISMGRNVVLRHIVRFRVFGDVVPVDDEPTEFTGRFVMQYTSHFSRSFDGGLSWDDENDDLFEVEGDSQLVDKNAFVYNPDPGNPIMGAFNVASLDVMPSRMVGGDLYARAPYQNDAEQGKVYRVANTVDYYDPSTHPHDAGDGGDITASDLYVSSDLCQTWKRVGPIGTKPTFPGWHTLYPYYKVIDTAAPIDPIFPWRMDARVEPPDWW